MAFDFSPGNRGKSGMEIERNRVFMERELKEIEFLEKRFKTRADVKTPHENDDSESPAKQTTQSCRMSCCYRKMHLACHASK